MFPTIKNKYREGSKTVQWWTLHKHQTGNWPWFSIAIQPFLKSPFLYSSIFFLAAAAYVGYIFHSRYESDRALERRNAEKQAEQRRENDRRAIEQLGGSELAIRSLYISPAVIHRGESADLCYDVDNAKTVTLDPPEGKVWPSHSRCLKLSPKKTTTYTLTVVDAAGKSASQSVELRVQ